MTAAELVINGKNFVKELGPPIVRTEFLYPHKINALKNPNPVQQIQSKEPQGNHAYVGIIIGCAVLVGLISGLFLTRRMTKDEDEDRMDEVEYEGDCVVPDWFSRFMPVDFSSLRRFSIAKFTF